MSVSWDIERIMGINGLTNENQTVRLSFYDRKLNDL